MVAKEFNHVLQGEDDEAEETLSLCDFAVNSNTEDYNNWKDKGFDIEDQGERSSSEDIFEFSSEEFFTSSTNYPTDNVMFCGKLIPLKQRVVPEQTRIINDIVLQQRKRLEKKSAIINYRPLTRGKSRWYLFVFGYERFPSEMELRDIKNRQSRRRDVKDNAAVTMFKFNDDNGGEIGNDKSNHKKGLWRLLKGLGCKSLKANPVAKASFGLRSPCS